MMMDGDTLPVLVTDDLFNAGDNVAVAGPAIYEGERFTPYMSLRPLE